MSKPSFLWLKALAQEIICTVGTKSREANSRANVLHWFRLPSGRVRRVRMESKEMGQVLSVEADAAWKRQSWKLTYVHGVLANVWWRRGETGVSVKSLCYKSKAYRRKQYPSQGERQQDRGSVRHGQWSKGLLPGPCKIWANERRLVSMYHLPESTLAQLLLPSFFFKKEDRTAVRVRTYSSSHISILNNAESPARKTPSSTDAPPSWTWGLSKLCFLFHLSEYFRRLSLKVT